MKLQNRPLLRNIFSSGASALLSAGLTALTVRVYVGSLGMERYGLWATLTVVVTLIHLSSFGVGPALTTRAAELDKQGERHAIAETLVASYAAVFALGAVAILVGYLGALPIARFFGLKGAFLTEGAELVPWVAVLAIASLGAQLVTSTLVGLGRADLASAQGLAAKVLQFGLSILMLDQGFGVKALVWGNTLGVLIQIVIGETSLRRRLQVAWGVKTGPRFSRLRPLLRLGTSLAFGSSFQIGLAPFGKWLLAQSAGLEAVSIYEIGWSVSMQVRALAAAAFQPTVPEFSRHKGFPERTAQLLTRSYRSLALVFTPLFACVGLSLPWLLRLWLGVRYSDELLVPTSLFLLGAWLSMFGLPPYYCLLGEGDGARLVFAQALQSVLNVLLSIALWAMFPYSPAWAALAMGLSVMSSSIYLIRAAGRVR